MNQDQQQKVEQDTYLIDFTKAGEYDDYSFYDMVCRAIALHCGATDDATLGVPMMLLYQKLRHFYAAKEKHLNIIVPLSKAELRIITAAFERVQLQEYYARKAVVECQRDIWRQLWEQLTTWQKVCHIVKLIFTKKPY